MDLLDLLELLELLELLDLLDVGVSEFDTLMCQPERSFFPNVICLKPALWKFNIDLLKCYRGINAIFDTDVFAFSDATMND